MRQLVYLVCCLGLGMPATAHAQLLAQSPASATSATQDAADPQTPSQPAQQAAPTEAPAESAAEETRSLFEPTWHQFMFGGRWSSVSGDPARWQRYQDLRDGVLFRDARLAREDPDGNWLFRASADNVGYRDQRFFANYERTGRLVISGLWDEIPQFYSVDTKTPYTGSGSPLLLDDTSQRAIQNGQTTLSAYLPIAAQFDLRERRDIGNVSLVAMPTKSLDLTATFTSQRHTGELPWGASFGFSNDVEVALPYDSRANDFTLGAEWTNDRNMLRVAYSGSWFDNLDDTLVWDSPLRLDDSADDGPGRGRMSLWPSNSAQTVSATGYSKFARRTQLTGVVSLGFWKNNEALQPFTINSSLPQFALPRNSAEAEARVFSTSLNLVSRPLDEWRFSARMRHYGYNNETPHAGITDYIAYDDGASTSPIGGPRLYAYDRTTFDADATWSGLPPFAFTVGYTRNDNGYDFRVFDDTGENVLHVTADAIGSQWVTFRAEYELADRTGSGLNEDLLVQTGEQPAMRHYDVADRTRNRFTGQVDVVPNDLWTFSGSAGFGKDKYDDSYFGLQESTFRVFSLAADYRQADGFGAGVSYNYERYAGLQRSRSASSGQTPPQETDPLRDWTTDSAERVNYFSIYATPPKIGANTEARLSYDYSYAEGKYLYGVVTGGPLPLPSQLPKVYNKLQQLHVDVRHRISKRLAATLSYLYEPFRVYDFAFDPTVVNSIIQPSSLVLGYVYRPYTAHSAAFGLMYFW
jgi:MtrB/PioB family decaheme-associated outer membrane protein